MKLAMTAAQYMHWGDTCLIGRIGPTRGGVPRLQYDIIDFQRETNVEFDYKTFDQGSV